MESGDGWMNVQMTSDAFRYYLLTGKNAQVAADFRSIFTSGVAARYANTTEQAAFLARVTIQLLNAPVFSVSGDGYNAGFYLNCLLYFFFVFTNISKAVDSHAYFICGYFVNANANANANAHKREKKTLRVISPHGQGRG